MISRRLHGQAAADGIIIIGAYADQDWFDNFNASGAGKTAICVLQGFSGDKRLFTLLDNTQSNRVLSSRSNFEVTKSR